MKCHLSKNSAKAHRTHMLSWLYELNEVVSASKKQKGIIAMTKMITPRVCPNSLCFLTPLLAKIKTLPNFEQLCRLNNIIVPILQLIQIPLLLMELPLWRSIVVLAL